MSHSTSLNSHRNDSFSNIPGRPANQKGIFASTQVLPYPAPQSYHEFLKREIQEKRLRVVAREGIPYDEFKVYYKNIDNIIEDCFESTNKTKTYRELSNGLNANELVIQSKTHRGDIPSLRPIIMDKQYTSLSKYRSSFNKKCKQSLVRQLNLAFNRKEILI